MLRYDLSVNLFYSNPIISLSRFGFSSAEARKQNISPEKHPPETELLPPSRSHFIERALNLTTITKYQFCRHISFEPSVELFQGKKATLMP